MVQFCPKCGSKDPDDDAVFCKKCGGRLPPHLPEKRTDLCPRCGMKIPDRQALFCDKCGATLHAAPPAPVPPAAPRPAPVQPSPLPPPASGRPAGRKPCPSCGALPAIADADYCDACGAWLKRPSPVSASPPAGPARSAPEIPAPLASHGRPAPQRTAPAPVPGFSAPELSAPAAVPGAAAPEKPAPAPAVPAAGGDGGAPGNGRSKLKWGIVAAAVFILLVVLASFVPGMLAGSNQTANATPAATMLKTTAPTPVKTTTPVTTVPPVVTTSPVPTATKTATATATPTGTKNATARGNTTANATAVTTTLSVTDVSQPLSVGQSATDGKARLTVNGFSWRDKLSDPIPSYAIGKKFLVVDITYENLGNKTEDVFLSGMTVTDIGGFSFDRSTDSALENIWLGNEIPPRVNRTGNLAFIVPPEATFLKLKYDFGNGFVATFQLT